jgi:DNA-binding transcriptional regulator YhcF (GntR family)
MEARIDVRVDRTSGVALGTQLVERFGEAIAAGDLKEGDRLPSVRELAGAAAVNVNTVRAVYARLEADGLARREHGRGTFVAGPRSARPERELSRQEIRDQITALEATLARLPPPPSLAEPPRRPRPAAGALLSTDELLDVRNRLLERLEQLDTERTALLGSLEQLGVELDTEPAPSRRATPSLAGARIRWVGA